MEEVGVRFQTFIINLSSRSHLLIIRRRGLNVGGREGSKIHWLRTSDSAVLSHS